jgi:hypothetical protein
LPRTSASKRQAVGGLTGGCALSPPLRARVRAITAGFRSEQLLPGFDLDRVDRRDRRSHAILIPDAGGPLPQALANSRRRALRHGCRKDPLLFHQIIRSRHAVLAGTANSTAGGNKAFNQQSPLVKRRRRGSRHGRLLSGWPAPPGPQVPRAVPGHSQSRPYSYRETKP